MAHQKTAWLLRMPIRDEDNGAPCLDVFVFDPKTKAPELIEQICDFAKEMGHLPGSYVVLDQTSMTLSQSLFGQALKDLEAPEGAVTIN